MEVRGGKPTGFGGGEYTLPDDDEIGAQEFAVNLGEVTIGSAVGVWWFQRFGHGCMKSRNGEALAKERRD